MVCSVHTQAHPSGEGESEMTENKFSYDEVPYSSFTFPQTRPDRLATLGAFHGMATAAPDKCRVLELGCGDGTNLLSFAYILPGSEFVGVDLSQVHIDSAIQAQNDLGLKNLTFLCEDVTDFTREKYGEFDYIIAHGLFSWVPDFVRTKILEIYAECLAPQGVGYISYNAYPGCKMREMLWDMVQYVTTDVHDPAQKVSSGIQFVNFINAAADKDTPYHAVIGNELNQYSGRTFENIFHDDFSTLNRPFYFHEFVDLIKPHGLQFLSEVNAYWTESNLAPEISERLDSLGDDVVKREQFIDFIKGRPFRSSLVCRDAAVLDRNPDPEILHSFHLASHVQPESDEPDIQSRKVEIFSGAEGGTIESSNPVTKAALNHLHRIWSDSIGYDELIEKASARAGSASAEDVAAAGQELLDFFKKGFVYLHRYRPAFVSELGEKPKVSRFVQWQVRRKCSNITALSGMNLKLDGDLMRLLLLLSDGTRTRASLIDEVARRITFEESKREESLRELPAVITARLADFAKLGLLES